MSSSRDVRPPGSVSGSAREPTESIDLASDDLEPASIDSLAHGSGLPREDMTKVESPAARSRPGDRSGERAEPAARSKPKAAPLDPDAPEHRVGHTFGSYKILELIGKGGMGYVYRAEHTKLGREVALKLLRADYAKRRDAVARFFQEARTVNRIRHRNIVDVTDLVELPDGTTFIIMELLRGQSLGRWARAGVDLPRSLAVLIQICDALAAAHAVGVIHRDLKPDNVIILPTADGAELVKLLDFGVAKLMNRDDEDFALETAAGAVIGTPAYMSPEQAGGMQIDARSDIYSIGAIMYELYCKQPMFKGRSFGEYVRKHLSDQPPRPSSTPGGAGMDDRLEAAILRAIEKAPDRRFATIGELRDILLHLLGAIETRPPTLGALPGLPGLAPATAPLLGTLPPPAMTALGTPADPLRPLPHSTTLPPPADGFASPAQAPTVHLGPPGAGAELPPSSAHVSGLYYPGTSSSPGAAPGSASGLHYSWPGGPITSPGQEPSGQYPGLRATHNVRAGTPMWVWLAGGAVAIALGIGGAAWIASGDEPPPIAPVAVTPGVGSAGAGLPAVTPALTTTPARVAVTLKSSPPAQVFALGETSALCTTPCTFEVDPSTGGAPDHREFVLRAKAYKDATVDVALSSDKVSPPLVALAPLLDPGADPGLVAGDPMPGEPDLIKGGGDGNSRGSSGRRDRDRNPKTGGKNGKAGVAPVDDLTGTGAGAGAGSGKTGDGKTGNGGKIDKIDKTDTIDPFK